MDDYGASARVFKIKYGTCLRKVIYPHASASCSHRESMERFGNFEDKIKDLFELPNSAKFLVTYIDNDDDVVTVRDDLDMKGLVDRECLPINPVQVQVTLVKPSVEVEKTSALLPCSPRDVLGGRDIDQPAAHAALTVDEPLKHLMRKLSSNLQVVNMQIQSYETLPEKPTSAEQISGLVENLFQTITIVTSVLSSAVKTRAN